MWSKITNSPQLFTRWLPDSTPPHNRRTFSSSFSFGYITLPPPPPRIRPSYGKKNCGDYAVYHRVTISFFNFETFFSAHVFRNSQSRHHWHFCITSNGNKLERVANQLNLNTNLGMSSAYSIETNAIGNYF